MSLWGEVHCSSSKPAGSSMIPGGKGLASARCCAFSHSRNSAAGSGRLRLRARVAASRHVELGRINAPVLHILAFAHWLTLRAIALAPVSSALCSTTNVLFGSSTCLLGLIALLAIEKSPSGEARFYFPTWHKTGTIHVPLDFGGSNALARSGHAYGDCIACGFG